MLENIELTKKRKPCKVGVFYDSLEEKDKAIFDQALGANGIGMKRLAHQLGAVGFRVSETPLYSHRDKSCGCFDA